MKEDAQQKNQKRKHAPLLRAEGFREGEEEGEGFGWVSGEGGFAEGFGVGEEEVVSGGGRYLHEEALRIWWLFLMKMDVLLRLTRIRTLVANLAKKMSYISTFGKFVGYVFFILADFILLREVKVRRPKKKSTEEEKKIQKIKTDKIIRLMAVAATVVDLFIPVANSKD
ncbi:hypothetical protein RJT34_19960 [Clitoria ternatea]|uniref:Uncharacterized protein n=1 Tax=Clitoria ternatea TaxID=43366 RepID=A0AAN9P584_CLITE